MLVNSKKKNPMSAAVLKVDIRMYSGVSICADVSTITGSSVIQPRQMALLQAR